MGTMSTITTRDEYGNIGVTGMDMAAVTRSLGTDAAYNLTIALERLANYEATGLTAPEVKAMLPDEFEWPRMTNNERQWTCPLCGRMVMTVYAHCPGCGVKLVW